MNIQNHTISPKQAEGLIKILNGEFDISDRVMDSLYNKGLITRWAGNITLTSIGTRSDGKGTGDSVTHELLGIQKWFNYNQTIEQRQQKNIDRLNEYNNR